MPRAPRRRREGYVVGLQASDATIAELLKPLGFARGQFGENHLGDREFLLIVLARRADATDVDLTLSGDPLKPHGPHLDVRAAMLGSPEWTSSAF